MRLRAAVWVAALVAAPSSSAPPAAAGDRPPALELRADVLSYDARREIYTASGGVELIEGERRLRAPWLAWSARTRRGVASGDVWLQDGRDTLRSSFVEFDWDTSQGVLFDLEFESDELRMRGAEVTRRSEREYCFRRGSFTTCRCDDPEAIPPWELKAERADLELEGYGTARNARFEVLGVPVLWLPWLLYPVKTERQTGLLLPEIEFTGRNGVELAQPIFWAVGEPLNLVATPRWLQERGFKADLEGEFVMGEDSGGSLGGSFLDDRDVAPRSRRTPFRDERWSARGDQDLAVPGGGRLQAQYAFASDNAHAQDFDDLAQYREDRFLPAQAHWTQPLGASGGLGLMAGAAFGDDRQAPDDSDRDDFLLQRLPEARATALPQPLPSLPWLVPALDVEYAHFGAWRRPQSAFPDALLVSGNGTFFDTGIDGLPDSAEQGRVLPANPLDPNADDFATLGGSEGDGRFQEGELLADQGQRARFEPRLGVPLRLFDALEFYPELGWQETLYGAREQGFERRGFAVGRADLRTRLRRRFQGWSHLLEPRLAWAFVEGVSQGDKPLFVPATAVPQDRVRQLNLDNVTRDSADRVRGANALSFALGNRIYGAAGEAGVPLRADVVVAALYDFAASAWGGVFLDGRAYPLDNATLRFGLGVDAERGRLGEALLSAAWRNDRGDRAHVGYRYLREIPEFFEAYPEENDRFRRFNGRFDRVNQVEAAFRAVLFGPWALTYRGAFSLERAILLANRGGVEYLSPCRCWGVRVEVGETRSRGVSVNFGITLLGLGDRARDPFGEVANEPELRFLDASGGL